MSPFGKVHIEDDIWFNEPRSVAFVRYKWELDAGNAQKALDRAGSAMFNLPEVCRISKMLLSKAANAQQALNQQALPCSTS